MLEFVLTYYIVIEMFLFAMNSTNSRNDSHSQLIKEYHTRIIREYHTVLNMQYYLKQLL